MATFANPGFGLWLGGSLWPGRGLDAHFSPTPAGIANKCVANKVTPLRTLTCQGFSGAGEGRVRVCRPVKASPPSKVDFLHYKTSEGGGTLTLTQPRSYACACSSGPKQKPLPAAHTGGGGISWHFNFAWEIPHTKLRVLREFLAH